MHLVHLSMGFRTSHQSYFPGYVWGFISYFGNIGVLLFFVISGFVIEYTNTEKFSGSAAKRYLAKRFIRIYPIYCIVILLSFFLSSDPSDSLKRVFGNLVFLQTWYVDCLSNNTLMWTLHLEVAFYLLYLLVWKFQPKVKYLLVLTSLCALISPFFEIHVLRIFGYFFVWLLGLQLAREYLTKKKIIEYSDSNWKWFWAAIFSSVAYTNTSIIEILVRKNWVYGAGYLSLVSVVVISGCLVTIVAVPLKLKVTKKCKVSVFVSFLASAGAVIYAVIQEQWFKFTAYPLASLYLILALLFFLMCKKVSFKTFLESAAWLGSISYSLYIVQEPVYKYLFSKVPTQWSSASWWIVNAVVFAFIIYLAHCLEAKIQPFVSKRLRKVFYL